MQWEGNSNALDRDHGICAVPGLFGVLIFGGIAARYLRPAVRLGGDRRAACRQWSGLSLGSLLFGGILGAVAFVFTLISEALPVGWRRRWTSRRWLGRGRRWFLVIGEFSEQRRLQWRRWQFRWRRRIGELVAWASNASAGICSAHRWRVRKAHLPPPSLAAIEQAIKACEADACRARSASWSKARSTARRCSAISRRASAPWICSRNCRIWDTAHNNRRADLSAAAPTATSRSSSIAASTPASASRGWEAICQMMEARVSGGHFEHGVIKGIEAVSQHLAAHFPRDAGVGE